jgi:hypothetical protein
MQYYLGMDKEHTILVNPAKIKYLDARYHQNKNLIEVCGLITDHPVYMTKKQIEELETILAVKIPILFK